MCTAIIRYAQNNVNEIIRTSKKIAFTDVLDYYKEEFPKNKEAAFLSAYLKEYYLSRCTQFENDLRKGDKVSEYDLHNDKSYKFGYEGVIDLF